jgi:nucleobase:cation symporter-1, NCS1 family
LVFLSGKFLVLPLELWAENILVKYSEILTNNARAVKNAGGAGHMFRDTETSAINVGWGVMYGITAILGAWGSGTLGQSDWTRYANRRLAPTLAQTVAAPVTITLTALIGIIVTSAAQDVLGQIVWNPIYLLADIQEFYGSSPRARAGVFFASIGMVSTQLAVRLRIPPLPRASREVTC